MSVVHWVNGARVEGDRFLLPLDAPALLYGAGLFETMRLESGRLLRWTHHSRRLHESARRLSLKSIGPEALRREVATLLAASGVARGRVRLGLYQIDREGRTMRTLSVAAVDSFTSQNGVTVGVAPFTPPSVEIVGMKSANYLPHFHALDNATEHGRFDFLRVNDSGEIIEGYRSNIFLLNPDRGVVTADAESGLLPGVARAALLRQAARAGMSIEIARIGIGEVTEEWGMVLTNSLRGSIEVHRLLKIDDGKAVTLNGSERLAGILHELLAEEASHSSLLIDTAS